MRKMILTALLAAVAVPVGMIPTVASAQSWRDVREERRDVREERRELRQAERSGDPRRIREERRDLREERGELRRAQYGRDDWRGWRDRNGSLYARGNWNAPFRYNAFRPGARIARPYWGQRYWIANPARYHLPPAYGARRWVRHYNDVVLVDTRRGVVVDVIRSFYR